MAKERIVILGGGMGALTTAYYLTSEPGWADRYEVTLYQPGWRLGGKCASSRRPEAHYRSEEHGLHVWFGFYENAFRMVRDCYRQLDRPPSSPLATVEDAFVPRDFTPMLEQYGDRWEIWPLTWPRMPGTPGTATEPWEPWRVLIEVAEFVVEQVEALLGANPHAEPPTPEPPHSLAGMLASVCARAADGVGRTTLHAALLAMKALHPSEAPHAKEHHGLIRWLLGEFRTWFHTRMEDLVRGNPELSRLWHMVDLGIAILVGVLDDDLLLRGLPAIDDVEFREWLMSHGATRATADSTPIRALYDCCFAYDSGDLSRPNFAAGAALGCALRIAITYRGAVLYEMTAGMGEVVVAPLYLLLKERGVQFRFFHRVTALEPDAEGGAVARVRLGVQANVRSGEYDPLITVNELAAWPADPLYDQLAQGEALRDQHIDLESWWTPWPDVDQLVLEAGADYDRLVLGISLGALPFLTPQLMEVNANWKAMVESIPTMQTQAAQLWMTRSLTELGWQGAVPAMVAAPEPMDVWADMSHVVRTEDWPFDALPRSLHYLCGPLQGNFLTRPPGDHGVPAEAKEQVRRQTAAWLEAFARWLWPAAAGAEGFDWSVLQASPETQGEARLDAQWLRANVDPTERYVLSPAGANAHRLAPGASGFRNMVLAGDWTRTPINAGCVEATVMSGMAASRALCGYPETIYGEDFLQG